MTRDDQLIHWLALAHVPKMGPVALRKAWSATGSVEQMWADVVASISDKQARLGTAEQEYAALQKTDIKLLVIDANDYPVNLKYLSDISPILYLKGCLSGQDDFAVGVVGSRKVTTYGSEVTQHLTSQLVTQRATIVSGLALGVDTIAHQAALDANGRTIAVLGSGLDRIYPSANEGLAERIAQHGAIISQFPLGMPASTFTFPARNKLIAGLSLAVVVTEAQSSSGALITAQEAQKYQRPVFAVPGPIFNHNSVGTHQLLQGGAGLAVDAAAIVHSLGAWPSQPLTQDATSATPPQITTPENQVLELLQAGPQSMDALIRGSALSASEALATVSLLEVKGLIKPMDNGEYRKM